MYPISDRLMENQASGHMLPSPGPALEHSGSITVKTDRNIHFDRFIILNFKEIGMENIFTYRMKLYIRKNTFIFISFNIQIDKGHIGGINQRPEENSRSMKLNMILSPVQYTGNIPLVSHLFHSRLGLLFPLVSEYFNCFHCLSN